MKLIHTSDWHLGHSLYGRKRYKEFAAFLDWLAESMEAAPVDLLIVAGDVFDNGTPSNRAQALYYKFLRRVAGRACRHVVVVGGNHDSPSFLNAPSEVLGALGVNVVGRAAESPTDEVLVLNDASGDPAALVCAVPYLRDRDIRVVEPGESMEDKDRKLVDGVRAHYAQVCEAAVAVRDDFGRPIPIIATGHLFTAGGRVAEGDGVRELYIGSLAHVGGDTFPEELDYLALGHLHGAQRVDGLDTRRYSGSPLPMGFGDVGRQKVILRVELGSGGTTVTSVAVPSFQHLEVVRGNWSEIEEQIERLRLEKNEAWLEVIYDGEEVLGDINERLREIPGGVDLDILRVRNERLIRQVLGSMNEEEELTNLSEEDVFARCLDEHDVSEDQRLELTRAFAEVLRSVREDDERAE